MPHKCPSEQQLIKAGFRHEPTAESPDAALCDTCLLCPDGWEEADDPYEEHVRRSPRCEMLKKHAMESSVGPNQESNDRTVPAAADVKADDLMRDIRTENLAKPKPKRQSTYSQNGESSNKDTQTKAKSQVAHTAPTFVANPTPSRSMASIPLAPAVQASSSTHAQTVRKVKAVPETPNSTIPAATTKGPTPLNAKSSIATARFKFSELNHLKDIRDLTT